MIIWWTTDSIYSLRKQGESDDTTFDKRSYDLHDKFMYLMILLLTKDLMIDMTSLCTVFCLAEREKVSKTLSWTTDDKYKEEEGKELHSSAEVLLWVRYLDSSISIPCSLAASSPDWPVRANPPFLPISWYPSFPSCAALVCPPLCAPSFTCSWATTQFPHR
jgi:hypothetical protein